MPYKDPGKRRAQNKESVDKYRQTEKGKAARRKAQSKHYWNDPAYQIMKVLSCRYNCEVGVLKAVRERDKVCQHCSSDQHLSFDHIIPASKGGKATMENLQLLCQPCNSRKGNR